MKIVTPNIVLFFSAIEHSRGNARTKKIPCSADFQFICEFDASVNHEKKFNEIEVARFLRPLTSYNIGSQNTQLFLSVYEANWPSAIITCKNSGMELMTPKSEEEEAILRKKIKEDVNIPSPLHIGATAMGSREKLYAIHTGKILYFDLETDQEQGITLQIPEYFTPDEDPNYDGYDTECLQLLRSDKKFHFRTVDCINFTNHFICQKISEKTNEGIASSPSPVLL